MSERKRENGPIRIHEGPIDARPEAMGYRAGQLDLLDDMFRRVVGGKRLQAAGYIIRLDGRTIAHRTMGVLDGPAGTGELKPDSIRRIASITKAFTAVAIMQLIEDGVLYRWQPVASIIDEFDTPLHRGIEIGHLLTHTSGLPADGGYFNEPYSLYRYGRHDEPNWFKFLLSGSLQAKPGEAWNYSSSGFVVLGEVIRRVTGMPYHAYVTERIVKPLGLKRTFFEVPSGLRGDVCIIDDWDRERMEAGLDKDNPMWAAGGGLYSTLADLADVADMIARGGIGANGARILGRKTVDMMLTNHVGDHVPAYHWGDRYKTFPYGLGVKVYPDGDGLMSPGTFSHEGAGRCALYADPAERLTAVWFVPTTVDWVPESLLHPKNIIWAGLT